MKTPRTKNPAQGEVSGLGYNVTIEFSMVLETCRFTARSLYEPITAEA